MGAHNAASIASYLKCKCHKIKGIRLDSGDLLDLSQISYEIFNKRGFPNIMIVASGDLDEYEIARLKASGAKINAWGVGTKLATSFDYPALGGVYKLAELEGIPKIKIAGEKTTNPCQQKIWRSDYGDAICLADETPPILEGTYGLLTKKIIQNGKLVYKLPAIEKIKDYAKENLKYFPEQYKLIENPKKYPVRLSPELHTIKDKLLNKTKGISQ